MSSIIHSLVLSLLGDAASVSTSSVSLVTVQKPCSRQIVAVGQ